VSRERRSILHTARLGSRRERSVPPLSQLAWAHSKAVEATNVRLLAGPAPMSTPVDEGDLFMEKSGEDLFQLLSITSHLVWGRVVPDIPEFCRELVAALAEE
jgi:hypothetical protein